MSAAPDSAAALRQALVAIRKLRAKLDETAYARTEPIAVVGLSCRFPGGVFDSASYWSLLAEQRNAVVEIPPERFDVASIFDADPHAAGKTYSRWAGLIDRPDLFDAEFFGISPREAEQTDPQQRLFLEGAWTALEHAGIAPSQLKGTSTGVFVGVTASEYGKLHDRIIDAGDISAYSGQGLALNAIAGRVAHFLGLHGPALTMDTACSSSLVAVDRACRSLRDGESTLALAAGVNLIAAPETLVTASRWGMFSPAGRCASFSAGADGFVRGEGCGVVVLKRLSAALADGNRVLGVILGSSVNHDGPSSGLTVPNGVAQQALLRQALTAAGIGPEAVGYVEAHGTGTTLGDPIEAEALGAVLRPDGLSHNRLLIGSVKTNIGHTESAAGIAGLIKVLLSLQHRQLPGQLHFAEPSPRIRWDALGLEVVDSLRPWEPIDGRRIAGVSAFGFSGTNAHVIVAEAPAVDENTGGAAQRPIEILSLSARTDSARRALARAYAEQLTSTPEEWPDVCHTAAAGRAPFEKRLTVRAADGVAAAAALAAFAGERESPAIVVSESKRSRPRIAFAFTGQGSQYAGMGSALYAGSPIVRRVIDAGEALLTTRLDVPLGAVMRGEHPDAARLLSQTRYTQPALFTLEFALATLWRELGVEPVIVFGHSLGEYVAAAVAGIFSFEDGLSLVADRAALMQQTAPGAMLAVGASETDVIGIIDGWTSTVSVAAINGPTQVTLAGEPNAIAAIASRCKERGWRTAPLPVSHAFHSPLLDPIGAAFELRASQVPYRAPDRHFVSNLTGRALDAVDAAYWRAHAREPVRFADNVDALDALGCDVLLEIGPKPVLLALAQPASPSGMRGRSGLATIAGPGREWDSVAAAAQSLHAAGVELDWRAWNREYARRIVDAPLYPFERQRYWLTPSAEPPEPVRGASSLLGSRLRSAHAGATFETRLATTGGHAWLGDHRMGGDVVLPATAFLEMMLAAGAAFDERLHTIGELELLAPLQLGPERARLVQTIVEPAGTDRAHVRVFAADCDEDGGSELQPKFRLYASAYLYAVTRPAGAALDRAAVEARCAAIVDHAAHYRRLAVAGADFGPAFTGLVRLQAGDREALATITATVTGITPARPHPALLDACLQAAAATLPPSSAAYMPVALERLELFADRWPETVLAHARLVSDTAADPQIDFDLYDVDGLPLAYVRKFTLRETAKAGALLDAAPLFEVTLSRLAPVQAAEGNCGRWILLADRCGIAAQAAERIDRSGGSSLILDAETVIEGNGDDAFDGIIDCRAIDAERMTLEAAPQASLQRATAAYANALALIQRLTMRAESPALYLVSAGSARVHGRPGSPAQAIHAALRKTVLAEFPHFTCRTIALDTNDADSAAQLFAELGQTDAFDVAYAGGERFASRIVPIRRNALTPDNEEATELRTAASGLIEDVRFARIARRPPRRDEIEIETRATGLNFRDALNALGMLGDDSRRLGGECAGVVVRSGAESGFAPGDAVMAFCPGQSGSFVTVSARDAVPKPSGLSFAEAAGLPIAVMTAIYAFDRVAGLRPGETVLIHAAAGGVGLAAVHLALARGAIVFATAGSDEKREYLRGLGIEFVMDSRSPGFGASLRERTGGHGVDVVLNSLSGAFITEGFGVLAPAGRFIELGKREVLTAEQARRLRPDVTYTIFDLGEEAERDSELIPALLGQTRALVEAATLPALPVHVEPFAGASAALKNLARARNIGKHVLLHRALANDRPAVSPNGAYLITGAFGSLGIRCAEWLVRNGAKVLILAGRRQSAVATSAIAAMRRTGTEVREALIDCTERDALRAQIDALPENVPLRGVMHCAGELIDATLARQTPDTFRAVASAKIAGTIALHQACAGHELDLFVLFSSAAGVLGSPGQANYAAANAAMDELARLRRARGLPAITVQWGPWDGGMTDDPVVRRRLDDFIPLDAARGFRTLETMIVQGVDEAAVLQLHSWRRFLETNGLARDPFFAHFAGVADGAEPPPGIAAFPGQLAAMQPRARRRALLEHVHQRVAAVLGLRAGVRIAEDASLHDCGLDSLMSVELRNALAQSLALKLSPTLALDYPTTGELADYLLKCLFGKPEAAPVEHDDSAIVAALTDSEAEEILLRELAGADV